MNTTLIKFNNIIILLFGLIIINAEAVAAGDVASQTFDLRVGGSFSMLLNKLKYRKLEDINIAPSLGIFWRGGKLLSIGLDASYIKVISETKTNVSTEFGETDYTAGIRTVPISLLFSMQINDVKIFGGGGVSILNSKIEAFGVTTFSYRISPQYVFGASWSMYEYEFMTLELESRTYLMPEIYKTVTMLGLIIDFNLNEI